VEEVAGAAGPTLEETAAFSNLYAAFRKAARGKRKQASSIPSSCML